MKRLRILYLTHHWKSNSHHAKHSGFQRLANFLAVEHTVAVVTGGNQDSDYVDEHGIRIIEVKTSKRDFLFLNRLKISKAGRDVAHQFDIIHALYSDCTFFLPENKFIVTFHVLPGVTAYKNYFDRTFIILKYLLIQKKAMRNARYITCVSTNLLKEMPVKYKSKAFFLPHGIDTAYWNPDYSLSGPSEYGRFVLSIGSHGIDNVLLFKIVLRNPSIHFVLVGNDYPMEGALNVTRLKEVSDSDLRNLYKLSSAIIRPLLFATANNSVLESLSMGKLIIASRIPGITDYLNEGNCIFIDQLEDFTIKLPDKDTFESVRDYAISHFSWQAIQHAYLDLYFGQHTVL